MDCEYESFQGEFKCKYCGKIRKKPYRATCVAKSNLDPPSMIQRAVNFGQAVVDHIVTGLQHCTDDEKRKRFEICKSNKCGKFLVKGEGGICAHVDCGCYIRSSGKFFDKLSWAESKCPEGYWGPVKVKDAENP